MKLGRDLADVPGRILPPEKIVVADRQTHDAGHEADWTRSLRNSRMINTVDLTNWIILFPQRSQREAGTLCENLAKVGQGMRFMIPRPARLVLDRRYIFS